MTFLLAAAMSPRTEAFFGMIALLMAFFLFGLGTLYFWLASRRYKEASEHLKRVEELMAKVRVTAKGMGIEI